MNRLHSSGSDSHRKIDDVRIKKQTPSETKSFADGEGSYALISKIASTSTAELVGI